MINDTQVVENKIYNKIRKNYFLILFLNIKLLKKTGLFQFLTNLTKQNYQYMRGIPGLIKKIKNVGILEHLFIVLKNT